MNNETSDPTKEEERLHGEIKETCRRAFIDALGESMKADPPAYDWIVDLYREIRDRLVAILKKGSPLRLEIEATMDVDLFSQMIRNDAFRPEDLEKLTTYTFEKCKQLGSPGRDAETDLKMKEVFEKMSLETASFASVVPVYIVNLNHCIDTMYQDLHEFLKLE